MKKLLGLLFIIILIAGTIGIFVKKKTVVSQTIDSEPFSEVIDSAAELVMAQHPLSIEHLRNEEYPGSDLQIEENLASGSNYKQYVVSYQSEGLKQYALLTVPNGTPPEGGWPAIVFNHGYIAPSQYKTTERYVNYVGTFARNGYIVLKPDYRGHGNSEGAPTGAYSSPGYVVDVLNAFSSLKKYPNVNPAKIGMWGHSMGGYITLRAMVVNPEIKAGVIWAGVVGSYPDLLQHWRRGNTLTPTPSVTLSGGRGWRTQLVQQYGEPSDNSPFWKSISATSYLQDISGPLQIHHATGDQTVPVILSKILQDRMEEASKESELFVYQGDDHNISANFSAAMRRSVDFFNEYLKS